MKTNACSLAETQIITWLKENPNVKLISHFSQTSEDPFSYRPSDNKAEWRRCVNLTISATVLISGILVTKHNSFHISNSLHYFLEPFCATVSGAELNRSGGQKAGRCTSTCLKATNCCQNFILNSVHLLTRLSLFKNTDQVLGLLRPYGTKEMFNLFASQTCKFKKC